MNTTSIKRSRVTTAFPHGNMDVSRYLSEFVGDESYLTFSTTCQDWMQCDNNVEMTTRLLTKDTTVSQLKEAFDMGFFRATSVCKTLASMGRLDLVEYAVQHGCRLDCSIYEGAAESNSIDVMEFAHSMNVAWEIETGDYMVKNGHLNVLKWALDKPGIELGPMICYYGATRGHLDIVEWCVSNGWVMSHQKPGLEWQLCADVSYGGHLDILKFEHSIGCKWCLEDVMYQAMRGGHFDIAKWSLNKGCVLREYHLEAAQEERRSQIVLWMLDNM